MWYLVNLPGNNLNVAVKTEKNSIAADCLNKVSFCPSHWRTKLCSLKSETDFEDSLLSHFIIINRLPVISDKNQNRFRINEKCDNDIVKRLSNFKVDDLTCISMC